MHPSLHIFFFFDDTEMLNVTVNGAVPMPGLVGRHRFNSLNLTEEKKKTSAHVCLRVQAHITLAWTWAKSKCAVWFFAGFLKML